MSSEEADIRAIDRNAKRDERNAKRRERNRLNRESKNSEQKKN